MDLREQGNGAGRRSRHPWERARLGFVTRLLARHRILPETASVLDVGAGDGWLATHLAKDFGDTAFTCLDSLYEPLGVMSRTLLVIPCFNEAQRLRLDRLSDLVVDVPVLFVDDGSTDSTAEILAEFCQTAGPHRATLLKLATNVTLAKARRSVWECATPSILGPR